MGRRWIVFVALGFGCAGSDNDPAPPQATLGGTSGTTATETEASDDTEPVPDSDSTTTDSTATDSTTSGSSSNSTTTSTTTSSDETSTSDDTETGDPPELLLPTANAMLDYQLGDAYDPPAGVQIVSRDRTASPAAGLYNICYVNGYQTQPSEQDWWLSEHPDLVLRDADGDPFIDPDWDEILLDIRTPPQRDALAEIVGEWIEGCADDGFDAIEIDNLDTYSRSDGLISQDNAVEYMRLLSDVAHSRGLAIAQKNSTEIADRQPEMDTDFAVAEECNRWDECQDYKAVYGDLVFVIEYREDDFDNGCANFPELSIVFRDLNLVGPGAGAYVYDAC